MRRLLAAGALLLLPLSSCHLDHGGSSIRRVMVVEGPVWVGLLPEQRHGLRLLLEDLVETAGATVLPAPSGDGPAPPGVLRITLGGTLSSGSLRLQGRLQTAQGLERDVVPDAVGPGAQLRQLLEVAGLHSSASAAILPRDPAHLLPLAAVYAAAVEGTDQEARAANGPAETLAILEPTCAPAALACAQSSYRRLLTQNPDDLDAQVTCARAFDTALRLLPGFPRAAGDAGDAGRFYTDTGNQRRALEVLFGAARLWPWSPGLRTSMAYAARTTGLLQGALAALRVKTRLDEGVSAREELPEAAYLYTGDWDRFEASLGPGPSERPDPLVDFYRGYLRLLQGRREEALTSFRSAARPLGTATQFQALSRVYQLGLQGHRPEALLALRGLALSRRDLRAPDGEFTFKLAEAYGFLDSPEEALNTAQAAFSQGFGCTAWYERTPLLAALRGLPRWRALDSHLQERQALLETRFSARTFGAKVPGA